MSRSKLAAVRVSSAVAAALLVGLLSWGGIRDPEPNASAADYGRGERVIYTGDGSGRAGEVVGVDSSAGGTFLMVRVGDDLIIASPEDVRSPSLFGF